MTIPLPRVADSAFVSYTSFVVVVAMLFGGAARQGLWSDALVQLAALPLLPWALFKLAPSSLDRSGQWGVGLLCAIVALPLVQLAPLPPSLWRILPGRAEIASAYEAAGLALPWIPISLDAMATWRSLLSLLPAVAVFLAMLSLNQRQRRILIALVLAAVFASVLLDLLQTMGGTDSPLRFYAITNPDRAVGFFANANHNAAFLYCAVPFIAAWAIGLSRDHLRHRGIALASLAVLLLTIIVGISVTRSRAGMALLLVAGLSGLLLAWRHGGGQSSRRLLQVALGANLIVLLLAFQFGFVAMIQRAEQSEAIEDIRWPVAQVTSRAAIANMPFGTGLGTFVPVYDRFAPRTLVTDRYVNHTHNDWLELWLTGGAPAILIVLGFLVWYIGASVRLWRHGERKAPMYDIALARAASIVIALLLLHSVIDYPLRTIALMVLFATASAYLIPGRPAQQAER